MTKLSLRPSLRPIAISLLVALAAGAVTLLITWRLVRDDVGRADAAGVTKSGPYQFVGGISGLVAAIGYAITWRLLRGPSTTRRAWILGMARVVPTATSYRLAEPPSVQHLIDALADRGYRLTATQVDLHGAPIGLIDLRTELVGSAFRLRDDRLGADGTGVVIRISERAGDDGGGLGNVEAIDASDASGCQELATYAIAELGTLLPDLRYAPDDSALSPDTTELLRATLPDRPLAL